MKDFIEVPIENNRKLLLNIGQIATIETKELVSNSCHLTTSIKIEGNNQSYDVKCSYEEVKKLIENAF